MGGVFRRVRRRRGGAERGRVVVVVESFFFWERRGCFWRGLFGGGGEVFLGGEGVFFGKGRFFGEGIFFGSFFFWEEVFFGERSCFFFWRVFFWRGVRRVFWGLEGRVGRVFFLVEVFFEREGRGEGGVFLEGVGREGFLWRREEVFFFLRRSFFWEGWNFFCFFFGEVGGEGVFIGGFFFCLERFFLFGEGFWFGEGERGLLLLGGEGGEGVVEGKGFVEEKGGFCGGGGRWREEGVCGGRKGFVEFSGVVVVVVGVGGGGVRGVVEVFFV